MAVSSFRLRARLDVSIPSTSSGQRGITPAFGYGAPHSSTRGTLTLLNNALLSTHDENLRLENLAGKAVVGGHALSGKVDLWILGATTEVGDETVRQISEILGDYGVTLLVLDWVPRPLPPLAVLLAAARAATLEWFANRASHVDSAALASALDSVAAHPNFQLQAEELRRLLTACEVGLDALRQKMKDWLVRRFSNRVVSQRTFGQFITVADPSAPALPRIEAAKSLAEKMFIDKDKPAAVVLLGTRPREKSVG